MLDVLFYNKSVSMDHGVPGHRARCPVVMDGMRGHAT